MNDVNDYIVASKNVIDLFKALAGLLPKGDKHPEIQARLADAEKALRASEVQLAKSLGYRLCQCTFPPQIMLQVGRHGEWDQLIYKCPQCADQHPSELHFKQLTEAREQARREADAWRI